MIAYCLRGPSAPDSPYEGVDSQRLANEWMSTTLNEIAPPWLACVRWLLDYMTSPSSGRSKFLVHRHRTQPRELQYPSSDIVSLRPLGNSEQCENRLVERVLLIHDLFREASSFPRAKLEENCELGRVVAWVVLFPSRVSSLRSLLSAANWINATGDTLYVGWYNSTTILWFG